MANLHVTGTIKPGTLATTGGAIADYVIKARNYTTGNYWYWYRVWRSGLMEWGGYYMVKVADYGTIAFNLGDNLAFNNVNTMSVVIGSNYAQDDGSWNGAVCETGTRTTTKVTFRARGAKDGGRLISFTCTGPIATAKLEAILNGTL